MPTGERQVEPAVLMILKINLVRASHWQVVSKDDLLVLQTRTGTPLIIVEVRDARVNILAKSCRGDGAMMQESSLRENLDLEEARKRVHILSVSCGSSPRQCQDIGTLVEMLSEQHHNSRHQLNSTMSNPSHRARKRKKVDIPFKRTATTQDVIATDEHGRSSGHSFPLAAFLWPARNSTSQWITLPLILIFAGLFRWSVSLWGYSGYQKPPMHGDFEAQRHWMEITTHLPASMWYFYDLPYWGLDYPPLTAYHSWICGKM